MRKHYTGEIGTQILIDTETDISGASLLAIKFTKPDGTTTGEWISSLSGSTAISYTLQNGDLDQQGVYKLQAYVEDGSSKWWGETVELYVYDQFE